MIPKLCLRRTKRTDVRLVRGMAEHYSQPKGFVGRNLCYAVEYDNVYYGHIIAGSATRFLPGRNEFLTVDLYTLNHVINNIYFHVEPVNGHYPIRNFTQKVLAEWRYIASQDWSHEYGNAVWGFESLIELPRTGEIYKRDGWTEVGLTKGYTCKRIAGQGTDSWTGQRIWDTTNLRPKRVFARLLI